MSTRYQPMQPVETAPNGTKRFRENKIVRYLLDNGGIDLNDLARIDFPIEDRDQFTQLIGYSVSAAPLTSDMINAADTIEDEGVDNDRTRIVFLEAKLADIRESLKEPIADLFNIHPDDLAQGVWCQ